MRFPEFEGVWEKAVLDDLGDFTGGGTPTSSNIDYWKGTIPWISSSDLEEENISKINISRYITKDAILNSATKLCYAPVIAIVTRVGVGKIAYSKENICTSQDFTNITNLKCDGLFLSYLLSKILKKKAGEAQGTSIKGITSKEIKLIKLHIPSLTEQQKIASLLSLIDERITTQSKIIDRLESLIKAINNKLLNCESNKIPSLRFPEFSEKWEVVPLKDIALKVNTKNRDNKVNVVFSNSATQGLVLQNEYFDKEIANKDNLHEYYIVRPDDFVYNPRLSSNAEVGAMSVNHTKYVGLVSPLYTVFRVENSNIDIIFLESIFKSKVWHNYMRSIANYGARDDRMNIRNDDFFDLPLYIPKKLEQQKISLFLSSLSLKMKNEKDILSIYKQQKAYLLNNLFI